MWRLLHVTKESYKAADVDEHVIKVRVQDSGKKGFFVQGDTRSEVRAITVSIFLRYF